MESPTTSGTINCTNVVVSGAASGGRTSFRRLASWACYRLFAAALTLSVRTDLRAFCATSYLKATLAPPACPAM